MKADGTGGPMLTGGESLASSPDGKRIALGTATGRIDVLNLDGSSPAELTDGGVVPEGFQGGDGGPAWSHDGTRIAFIRSHVPNLDTVDGVYVVNADGSGIKRLASDYRGRRPAWLANDQGIAFDTLEDPNSETFHFVIDAVNPDGSNRRRLFSIPGQNTFGPVVAPDGIQVAFTISPVCPPGGQQCAELLFLHCQIMVVGSDLRPVQVTHEVPLPPINPSAAAILGIPSGTVPVGDQCAEQPSWSPDSSKLVFDDRNRIMVMNADGSNRQQITNRSDPFDSAPSSDHLDTQAVWAAA
jgi:Tol biopolymer transport system component